MDKERIKQPGHALPAPPATATIAEWMDYLSLERARSPGTIRVYMGDLNDFARFLEKDCGDARLLKATRDDIRRYIRTLTGVRKVEPASVRRAVASLRSFYRYVVYTGRRPDNPAHEIQLPRLNDRKPKALKESEVWQILSARVHDDDEELYLRDRAMFETLYASGVRVAELCNANIEDLNREAQWLWVPKGKGNRSRHALLNKSALHAIDQYLGVRPATLSKALFVSKVGNRLTTRTVHRAFVARLQAAGLRAPAKIPGPTGRVPIKRQKLSDAITPHSLRHSFARHLLEHGAELPEVQRLLGHAHITTTEIYVTPELTRIKAAYDKAHPRDRFEYAARSPKRGRQRGIPE
ncbi:MAG TPA: tyrosine-type recombinase/integrase [Candidatus Eremiobacteraceae bacterium]|nr:tyrosine-type recombinase/integrase [Candidatus Eremiobacteraceae bacterium]